MARAVGIQVPKRKERREDKTGILIWYDIGVKSRLTQFEGCKKLLNLLSYHTTTD